eukprot:4601690-Prorocentrum_lima.AAC.1
MSACAPSFTARTGDGRLGALGEASRLLSAAPPRLVGLALSAARETELSVRKFATLPRDGPKRFLTSPRTSSKSIDR